MGVNFNHLRSFHAVACERSVSQAARRLNISQPTLSKQIRELEDRHKIKLIEGSRPPLSLTHAGQLLLERTRALFEVADEIEDILGESDKEGGGTTLRLGTDSPPYAAEFMAALLREIPNLGFRVSVATALQTYDALMRGQIDLGIICEPPIEAGYVYVPLYRDKLVAVMSVYSIGADRAAFALEQIGSETLLIREGSSRTLAATNRLIVEAGVSPKRTMELQTREMIREAVAQGLGMSLMFARECPPDSRLRSLPLATSSTAIDVAGYLVYQTDRKRLPQIRRAEAIARRLAAVDRG